MTKQAPAGQNVKSYVSPRISTLREMFLTISRLKPHQIHDLAAAKEKEMEKIRKAFGIREDYVEGDAFKQMKERTTE